MRNACCLLGLCLMFVLSACKADSPALLHVQLTEPTLAPVKTALTPFGHTLPIAASVLRRLDLIQSDRLIYMIDGLVSKGTRHVLSPNYHPQMGIGAARSFLIDQFNAMKRTGTDNPLTVWTQPVAFTFNGIRIAPENVIATLQGTDIDAGVIVVGAHYDSISSAEMNSGQVPAPGANENASGVAAMLEIAHIMAAEAHHATILFVAFAAEETGRQGSIAFIKQYLQAQIPPIKPRAVLNLDTIGGNLLPSGEPGQNILRLFSATPNDSSSRQLARQIGLMVSAYPDMPELVVQSSDERIGRFGDQQSFSDENDAAVRFIEGTEDPSRQRTERDTLAAIQPAYLISSTRAALAAVSLLADGPDAPTGLTYQSTSCLNWKPIEDASGYIVALRQMASVNFDQVFMIGTAPEFIWPDLSRYAFAVVAAVDREGRIGQLSPEFSLDRVAVR